MPEIVHETVVSADPAEVGAALTTAEGLAGFYTDQVHAEPKAGTQVWFGFGPAAETQFRFAVTALTDEDVRWKCLDGPPEWVDTEVGWRLRPDAGDGARGGARTRVRFEHRGWQSAGGELGACSFVWAQILHRLDRYLATGLADPFFRADDGAGTRRS